MKLLAFGASTSKNSINKQFAHFAARSLPNFELDLVDLLDYPLPLFSVDVEKEIGIPENALKFLHKIYSADLIIISLAEHNGSYSTAFKNLFDWVSRENSNMFSGKKLLLLSTSPGGRGATNVLEAAIQRFPRHGAQIIASFSLPNFQRNFSLNKGIVDPSLRSNYHSIIEKANSEF